MNFKWIFFGISVILFSTTAYSQSYTFKTYNSESGLNHPYIYALMQDNKGYLWVGTAEGLYRYDGSDFALFTIEQGLADNFITALYQDKKGEIWIGHHQGKISNYYKNKFVSSINESNINSPITGFLEDKNNNIYCLAQNTGILKIKKQKENITQALLLNAGVYSFCSTPNGLLLGTNNGLEFYQLKQEKLLLVSKISAVSETKVQCIVQGKHENTYWVGTEDEGLFYITQTDDEFSSRRVGAEFGPASENIQYVIEDKESSLWVGTFNSGLYKLSLSKNKNNYEKINFTGNSGLKNKFVKTILEDREGIVWVGTYGGGLLKAIENHFSLYIPETLESANIVSLAQNKSNYYAATENNLFEIHKNENDEIKFTEKKTDGQLKNVTGLYVDPLKNIWIGTTENGIYIYNPTAKKITPFNLSNDNISKYINALSGNREYLWFATKGGLFRFNTASKKLKEFNTEKGLLHNNVTAMYIQDSITWCGTPGNYIAEIKNDSVYNHKIAETNEIITISCITADVKGNIWFGTHGNGIYMFNKKSFVNFTEQDGLKSNYCYSIAGDARGNIWVGHRGGLSKLNAKNGMINSYSSKDGVTGDCNPNAIVITEKDELLIGTTAGLLNYDTRKNEKVSFPPIPTILNVKFSDKEYDINDKLTLPYDVYKLRIDFKAITFNEGEKITYRYKLEGHDHEWTEPHATDHVIYNSLKEGDYTFLIEACNRSGVCNSQPLDIRFKIKAPIWKQWWFILSAIATLIYTFIMIIKLREKNLKRFQQHLKNLLDERTKLIVAQKEELEKKNKDITDSINYAKRIQEAILPPINKLKNTFPESFVYYQPRDIVSGDFYWYHRYEDKFIIACADSTGHGVPGALMSMIGSTLLKEFSSKKEITSPAELLKMLDSEIKKMMQQQNGNLGTNDGLDISVCEIDLGALSVKVACANRPVIFFRSDGMHYITRKAGTPIEALEDINISLEPGNCIYMFTDGYPDQFGGMHNKKLKIERFKSMLKEWQSKPMEQQQKFAKEYFEAWKGNHEQVDDVLLIGIKV